MQSISESERNLNLNLISERADQISDCATKYRSANAYLMSVLSDMFKLTIVRSIASPAHGKTYVDGEQGIQKTYLSECMRRSRKGDDNLTKNKFMGWAFFNMKEGFYAKQACRLCENPRRRHGIQGAGDKFTKRHGERRIHERKYFCIKKEDVFYKDLSMQTIVLKESKLKYGGTTGQYKYRTDVDLERGYVAIQRIPCPCKNCLKQLDLPCNPSIQKKQDQPRYALSADLQKYNIE